MAERVSMREISNEQGQELLRLVRRGSGTMLSEARKGRGYILDVRLFHNAVRGTLEDYFQQLIDPAGDKLRANLWKKMDHICRIRTARGLFYQAEQVSTP